MSTGLSEILTGLDTLAAYAGPWRALRAETGLLQARLAELKEREQRMNDVLLVALVGGSGVGKSTLLNALAGDQIAEASEMRPCTSKPTIYHPPGMRFDLNHVGSVTHVARSALENIALIDTPDSDTIAREHRAIVEKVLRECDLILLCADSEKYLDEATWSLLEPLRGLRAMVCVQTRVERPDTAVRDHWLGRLADRGFRIDTCFQVNARNALDRKLGGTAGEKPEFEFAALEQFLRRELDRERVARIKSSNAAGLLALTVNDLCEKMNAERERLQSLRQVVDKCDRELAEAALRQFTAGDLAEPHHWVQALSREVAVRSKGFTTSVFRIIEFMRSLPYRLSGLLSLGAGSGEAGIPVAGLFGSGSRGGAFRELPESLQSRLAMLQSELRMHFSRAGFEIPHNPDDTAFLEELRLRVGDVFSGMVQEGMAQRARWLSAWPVALILDCLPVAFIAYTGYLVVKAWWDGNLLPATSFLHAGVVLGILVACELVVFSLAIRLLAWTARLRGLSSLKRALARPGLAFGAEKALLNEAQEIMNAAEQLQAGIRGIT